MTFPSKGMTKPCVSCLVEKSVEDDFYKHPRMADGRFNKCKVCYKRDVKTNRDEKTEHYSAYEKTRANRGDRVAARAAYDQTARGKVASSRAKSAWSERNPEKRKAHNAVNNAKRRGNLHATPCAVCESSKVEGHHDDYSKPLDVVWLCSTHHKDQHREEDIGST